MLRRNDREMDFFGKQAKQQLSEMLEERDAINRMMDHMAEGLILLDRSKRILTVNQSAVALLGAGEREYQSESIVALSRNAKLLDGVDSALSGHPSEGYLERGEFVSRYFADTVSQNGEIIGVLVLLLEATEQRNRERLLEQYPGNVAHQLKAPLSAIVSKAAQLRRELPDPEGEAGKLAEEIRTEAARLSELTDNFLRLARVRPEEGKEDRVKVNLFSLLRGVCITFAGEAKKKGLQVSVDGDNQIVYGNLSMLHEMAQNLLDNAIRYNRPKGRVDIKVAEEDGHVVLTIADTGIGIPKECMSHLFDPYYQMKKGQPTGTGLGLSVVKSIVDYHDGRIAIESEEGKGTVIMVTF